MDISKAMNHYMNELNLNQSQFAVKCGMSISMTSKIARGERIPSVSTLQKISDTCEVKLSDFIRAAE
tara:strand:- start:376 stop:576 length:201 start_codon:yes stop_codon:yes gene_type:complete